MNNRLHSRKAQIMGEYAMTFVIASAAIIAMTVFMARVFQARIFDARRYMVDTVKNAAPHVGKMKLEYEPYYTNTASDVERFMSEEQRLETGAGSGKYYRGSEDTLTVQTNSIQLPPKDAD